jgi:spore coat polysaccharide biosynthesis predicted glycosyltransferase SpsG
MTFKKTKVLFHGDGDGLKGMRHLVRAIGLALEMSDAFECLVVTSNPALAEKVHRRLSAYQKRSIPILDLGLESNGSAWSQFEEVAKKLQQVASTVRASVVISDGQYAFSKANIEALQKNSQFILIGNNSEANRFADLAVFPTGHISEDWSTLANVRSGLDWVWIAQGVRNMKSESKEFDIVVSMGGADPFGLTARAMPFLARSERKAVVIGDAFQNSKPILEIAKKSGWQVFEGGEGLHSIMGRSHCVLSAFGQTTYECFGMGVPSLIVAHDESTEVDARLFTERYPEAGRFWEMASPPSIPGKGALRPKPDLGQLAAHLARELTSKYN